jgi:hypothetical protein
MLASLEFSFVDIDLPVFGDRPSPEPPHSRIPLPHAPTAFDEV